MQPQPQGYVQAQAQVQVQAQAQAQVQAQALEQGLAQVLVQELVARQGGQVLADRRRRGKAGGKAARCSTRRGGSNCAGEQEGGWTSREA